MPGALLLRPLRMVPSLPPNDAQTLSRLVAIAEEAGRIALAYFRPGDTTKAGIEWKGDGSPVTEADYAVNVFLEPALKTLWPGAAWLSEESVDAAERLSASHVIIVDPIDGTRGFARGDRHWAVAIALVRDSRPICGIVHAPAMGDTYCALAGQGATLNGASLRVGTETDVRPEMRITCPGSLAKSMREAGVALAFQPKIASLALRIVMVASGVYDAGFAGRDSHDWDLAAADLVLSEAGGILSDLDGVSLTYNRADPTHGALIASPLGLQPALRAALGRTSFRRNFG